MKKKAIVCVTNDLYTDQRVDKVCRYLTERGVDVTLVGRRLTNSIPLSPRIYKTKRLNLYFKKGGLFYAEFNLRLFFYLLFNRFDFLVSNDLDTLPACDLAGSSKGKKVVYDSHEYFTEVPELQNRRFIKSIWEVFEKMIFKNLDRMYTVNDSIAQIYSDKYKKKFRVVKNLPDKETIEKVKSRIDLGIPEDKTVLILQGAGINIERGAEELAESMRHLENCFLIFIGSGDVFPILEQKLQSDSLLSSRIKLVQKLPYKEMMQYTINSDLGFSLDKNTNPNYLYSLPNKLFDYIKAEVPVVVSNLVEIGKVVREYKVGEVMETHDPEKMATFIKTIIEDKAKMYTYKENCKKASNDLNWEMQKEVLDEIYKGLF